MRIPRVILLAGILLLPVAARGDESATSDGDSKPAVASETSTSKTTAASYEAVRPCIGSGYVPYTYPALGTCRCGNDGCFHPHRYYCCNSDAYKKGWLRKWVGTQLGKRSMLDDYRCECICPTSLPRPYLRTVKTNVMSPTVEPSQIPGAAE